jgi:hypothetical protein
MFHPWPRASVIGLHERSLAVRMAFVIGPDRAALGGPIFLPPMFLPTVFSPEEE